MRKYTTQMDAARQGIITPEMKQVALKEYRTPEEIMELVAKGQVAIPANVNHKCLNPEGVGSMLRTKINVNLGVSRDCKDYDIEMKKVLENTQNLQIIQSEAVEILTENGKVTGVVSAYGGVFRCRAVVVCTGVYLNGKVFAGEYSAESGPSGFAPANKLTANLTDLGFNVRRFKTGTPARIDGRTIDYSKCEIQYGETNIYPFSYLTERIPVEQKPCYLTYTNEKFYGSSQAAFKPQYHGNTILYGGSVTSVSEVQTNGMKEFKFPNGLVYMYQ